MPKPSTNYKVILEKTFKRRIPFAAHIELTYRCNLKCLHCYVDQTRREGELNTSEICRVLDELAEMGCLYLTLTGGEMFCRSDALRILEHARRRKFAMRIFTNGTLLTPRNIEKLRALAPVAVEISLYSMKPELHDRITGVPGSHRRTLAAIRECRSQGLPVVVKVILLKHNPDEFPAVRGFAQRIGADCKFDYVLAPGDDGSDVMAEHGLDETGMERMIRKMLRDSPPQPGEKLRRRRIRPKPDAPLCGAGFNAIAVNPQGDVYACLAIRKSAGNVRERPLREIWESPAFDFIRNARYNNRSECQQCPDAAYCTWCPGDALAAKGSIAAAAPAACMAARAQRKVYEQR